MKEHARVTAARSLVNDMLRSGLITFESRQNDILMIVDVCATVGIASKTLVASIDDRTRQHQYSIAERVVRAARTAIFNWGSAYSGQGGSVPKDVAADEVMRSLRMVQDEEREIVRT